MARKTHVAVEANLGKFSWRNGSDIGWFQPNGSIHVHGDDVGLTPNSRLWESDDALYSARIIVGFKVKRKNRWTMNDIVRIVKRERKKQVGNPSSTFLLQRGLYAHTEHEGGRPLVVDERGAQVIILNTPDLGTGIREFQGQMEELAETLATELRQEAVILEIQKGGLTVKTISMGPRA
jgi:hypothetical protein